MATLKAIDVENALCKKGFDRSNNDHRVFWLHIDGKKTSIHTKTSHNNQDIDVHLQSLMTRQMHLTKNEFLQFVSCQMNFEIYIKQLYSRNCLRLANSFIRVCPAELSLRR